jgi:sulfite reductase (NADPH) flavoprotein alpha-component
MAALPNTAPFSADQIATLSGLVSGSTPLQRSWLSGFLAGVDAANATPVAQQPAAPPRAKSKLTILYGSETGNAESLALKARKAAQKLGFDAKVLDMADATPEALVAAKDVVIIVSTWGEGDPPQRAASFYTSLMADSAPRLDGVRFAVLALGDTAYANFCATGRIIDERAAALGATRAADRIDLDLDFAKKAATWTDTTLALLKPADEAPATANIVHVDFKHTAAVEADEPAFDAERPFEAEISDIINLNGTGSSNETWHVEFATHESTWRYAPGDAIGVVPENDPALVAALLDTVGLGGDAAVARTLTTERDVTTLTRPLVQAYAKLTGRRDVEALAAPNRFADYAADRQAIDLFTDHKEKLTAQQLVDLLRPLPPRLYSVASSSAAHEGETHLLVGAVRWNSHGRARNGVASTFLAGQKRGGAVKLYVKPNRHFRLPTDPARPIIMIGAGTGVAPFRAFVEERAATGATGKNWLFFGARNYTTDFLYQLEWQDHLGAGVLTHLDVAFSRDQPEKIYVQHRIAERADALRGWVANGAHIYVCGDEKAMARDVDKALADVLGTGGLDDLRKNGRYQRDVY